MCSVLFVSHETILYIFRALQYLPQILTGNAIFSPPPAKPIITLQIELPLIPYMHIGMLVPPLYKQWEVFL